MTQITITAEELSQFRVIVADVLGHDVELVPGVFNLDEDEIVVTDEVIGDFLAARKAEGRWIIEGRDTILFYGHKGGEVVVSQFDGKTLATGCGILR